MNRMQVEEAVINADVALELLNKNTFNRPIRQLHVDRITREILRGRWKYNGDTIKISVSDKILDGQHRLWAVVQAKQPIETIIVRGLNDDAFATIDAVRQLRSGGDTIALTGTTRYRREIATAVTWLIRHRQDCIADYKQPQNRVENWAIEEAFREEPDIASAVATAMPARSVANAGVLAFVFYVALQQNVDLAVKFIEAMIDPADVATDHPFFRLRRHLLDVRRRRINPEVLIALSFKALNASARGDTLFRMTWLNQGARPEAFPTLKIAPKEARRRASEAA